ncbi:MAG: DUF4391 domain-containing protein [Clostridia bacterium]|nr:DUF4391 domain-containing protein [Clostridia bacterium]
MLNLSTKTQVNRRFTLRELYKQITADKIVKEDAKSILSVTLSNVLSNDTMNFTESGIVKEIYVFTITLPSKDIPKLFIAALDKAINLHTFFVLQVGEEYCFYGAYKEKTEKGVKLGKYYQTEWVNINEVKSLPLTVKNLDDVYTFLIDELIPITARSEESTVDFVNRYDEILRLNREIEKLQKQVDTEKQSKRRFELNDRLKELKRELEKLNEEG